MEYLRYALKDAALRTSIYFNAVGRRAFVASLPDILFPEADVAKLDDNYNLLKEQLARDLERGIRPRYTGIVKDLNNVALCAFNLAIATFLWHDFGEVWEELDTKGLTVEAAAKLTWFEPEAMLEHFDIMSEAFEQLKCFFHIPADSSKDPLRTVFRVDERLWGYLLGKDALTDPYAGFGEIVALKEHAEDNLVVRERYLKEMEKDCAVSDARSASMVFHFHGPEGNGKKYLVKHFESGKSPFLIMVDYGKIHDMEIPAIRRILWYFYREQALYGCALCIHSVPESISKEHRLLKGFWDLAISPYLERSCRIYLCTQFAISLIPYFSVRIREYLIDWPDREERFRFWTYMAKANGLEEALDYFSISSKYRLSAEQIRKAMGYLVIENKKGNKIDDRMLTEICDRMIPASEGGAIKRIKTGFTLDDLKIADSQKEILRHICAQITQRYKVFDTWNLKSRYAYGIGISCLFSGNPGTGKTMAAHVLSNMLGLPLFRIDLSQVVDKYIGESEKKLDKIFTAAERGNMILFFDEADALFGKRSEVNDSKDRYANTEVSFILQRIEEYDGISILATNNKKNIDSAFMRRIRFVVDFAMPDADTRKELWESCFTEEIPVDRIDFRYLADNFELTGSTIKNIALNAIFFAAENNSPVTMRYINDGIELERSKVWISGLG